MDFWLLVEALPQGFNPALTKQQTGIGLDGFTSWGNVACKMTPTSHNSRQWPESLLSQDLRNLREEDITQLQDEVSLSYLKELAEPPSILWQRPSPMQTYQIQPEIHIPTSD